MKHIVLDRDGVINFESESYIKTPEEWRPIPGSLEAIAKLTQAGITLFVATNQSGVGRGLLTLETLHAIHDKMTSAITAAGGKISKVYFCPHHPDDGCDCRKPKPGMLLQIAKDFDLKPESLLVIGDTLRDLQAAAAVGAKAILLRTGFGEKTLKKHPEITAPIFDNLAAAVENLLNNDYN